MSPLLAFLEHFEYRDGINLGRGFHTSSSRGGIKLVYCT